MPYAPVPVAPPPGIFRQATPRASRGRFFDGNLVRWRKGVLQPIGGWRSLAGLLLPEPARCMLEWKALGGQTILAMGTRSGLYVWDGSLQDITPEGFIPLDAPSLADGFGIGDFGEEAYGTARSITEPELARTQAGDWWVFDNWGEELLALSTSTGILYRWSPVGMLVAEPVENAPQGALTMCVTQERAVVLAGQSDDGRRLAWCDTENLTDWTATVDNLAGGLQIKTTGQPLAMKRVREGVLLLTDADAHLLRYLGAPFGYGLDRIASGCGPTGPYAVTSSTEFVVWLGAKSLWAYSGGIRPVDCPLAYDLAADLNQRMRVITFAGVLDAEQEVWFFWPSQASNECDRYLLWSWADNVWSWGRLQRTAYTQGAADMQPAFAGLDCKVYEHEIGWLADGQTRVGQIWAETSDLTAQDTQKQLVVRGVIPDLSGERDAVQFRFYVKEKPFSAERMIGPVRCKPTEEWIEKRFGGVNVRMRIEGARDLFWGIGEMRLDAVMGSGR